MRNEINVSIVADKQNPAVIKNCLKSYSECFIFKYKATKKNIDKEDDKILLNYKINTFVNRA